MQYLPHADLVVVMLEGRIAHTGTYSQLLAQGVDLAAFVPAMVQEEDSEQEQTEQQQQQQELLQLSPTAMSPTAAAATTTADSDGNDNAASPSAGTGHATANSSGGSSSRPLQPLKSFSDVISIELPASVLARSGGSFASHKPHKVGQDIEATAAAAVMAVEEAAADGSSVQRPIGAGPAPAAALAAVSDEEVEAGKPRLGFLDSLKDSFHSKTQLETINDLKEGEQEQQTAAVAASAPGETAAAAQKLRTPSGAAAAAGNGLANGFDHHASTDDDEEHGEDCSLMARQQSQPLTPSRKKQRQDQELLLDVSVHSDQQQGLQQQQSKGSEDGSSKGRLVKAEERARGQVRRSVYMAYLSAWGPLLLLPIAVAFGKCRLSGCLVQYFINGYSCLCTGGMPDLRTSPVLWIGACWCRLACLQAVPCVLHANVYYALWRRLLHCTVATEWYALALTHVCLGAAACLLLNLICRCLD